MTQETASLQAQLDQLHLAYRQELTRAAREGRPAHVDGLLWVAGQLATELAKLKEEDHDQERL